MLYDLARNLFFHERIRSTVAKVKEARRFAERLITRAKKNLDDSVSKEKKIHNIRLVSKHIKDKEVLFKLFNDIAPRFKERNGGYTKIIKLGVRNTDRSEMAFLELVDRKELVVLKEERKKTRQEFKNRRLEKDQKVPEKARSTKGKKYIKSSKK